MAQTITEPSGTDRTAENPYYLIRLWLDCYDRVPVKVGGNTEITQAERMKLADELFAGLRGRFGKGGTLRAD